MSLSMDEIYNLFVWDSSYTPEEYKSRVDKGIFESQKLKNIFPFIQPIIVPSEKSKSVWEPCAKVISLKSNDELKPYLNLLFEWLQDMNWPGAYTVFDRLLEIPFSTLEVEYSISRKRAEKDNDELWLMALDNFKKQSK